MSLFKYLTLRFLKTSFKLAGSRNSLLVGNNGDVSGTDPPRNRLINDHIMSLPHWDTRGVNTSGWLGWVLYNNIRGSS